MRRALIVTAAVGVAAAAAVFAATRGGGDAGAATAPASTGATAEVERRDLVDREEVDGTLGYAGVDTLVAGAGGTLTGIREPGDVVTRGHSLYAVDGEPAAWLLYGSLPAWRDFAPGMEDGEDVRQLERNLRALGYDLTVDDEWTGATTDAVLAFQEDRGMTEDGVLSRGEVVFRSGPTRFGESRTAIGRPVRPGAQLAGVSSTRREIAVDLDATRQELAREGDRVTVEMPTGSSVRGRIAEVGEVASQPAEEGADPTIEVRIALRGKAARGTGLDQAPVEVGFERERRSDVLAVPVTALLARVGGSFAVEVVDGDGRRRDVTVDPGLYADDYVEVEGEGLREGMQVVVAE